MITTSAEVEFDAGHRVPDSRCASPHGHRYRVRVDALDIAADVLEAILIERVRDPLDRGFLLYNEDLKLRQAFWVGDCTWKVVEFDAPTTVSALADWVWDRLADAVAVHRVEVWETPNTGATIEAEPKPELVTVNLNAELEPCVVEQILHKLRVARRGGQR